MKHTSDACSKAFYIASINQTKPDPLLHKFMVCSYLDGGKQTLNKKDNQWCIITTTVAWAPQQKACLFIIPNHGIYSNSFALLHLDKHFVIQQGNCETGNQFLI